MTPPKTKKDNIVDTYGDFKVSDPYRWLEDEKSQKVKEWVGIQNKHTEHFLKDEKFNKFSDELVKNFKSTIFSDPFLVNGLYFYKERKPDENQGIIYVKKGLNDVPVKLVDPNEMDKKGNCTIDSWSISDSGKYITYAISKGGGEMGTLYIKDVHKNIDLLDKITNCRHPSVRWLSDDSAFFYVRNPLPGTVPESEMHMHDKVYFHKLGDNPKNDILIFGENRPKDDLIGLGLSYDDKYLSIHVSKKWTENEIYIYERETKITTPFITNIPSKFYLIFLKDKALLKTNYKANNYRILSASLKDLFKQIDEWEEFVPEQKNLLLSISVTKDKILLEYLVDVCSKIAVLNHNGKSVDDMDTINLPEYSTLSSVSSSIEETEFFYGIESFIFPKITYRFIPEKNNFELYRATENPIEPKDYIVKQEWYSSKDGKKVPMFIIHKKSLKKDGNNPIILYGYGGFGNTEVPVFLRNWLPWFERGGVFAIANIRGGGEFGKEWHLQGIKDNKQNSFDDFIYAAEYLISEKYTSSKHLGISGGSNGGLLVSAVAMQKPELFKAVRSAVPLTDMVRFPMFGMAMRWVHEYGDPNNPADIKKILKWSPYHNVKNGQKYPSFLFTTGENDSRVNPLHARKMTAILQEMSANKNTFIFIDTDTGHGSGKPIWKVIEGQALALSFFARELDLN